MEADLLDRKLNQVFAGKVVRITDFGHPFEPSEPPEPDPEAMLSGEPGGIGIYFIYRSVDSVSYEAAESGNTLTLVKRLRPSEK